MNDRSNEADRDNADFIVEKVVDVTKSKVLDQVSEKLDLSQKSTEKIFDSVANGVNATEIAEIVFEDKISKDSEQGLVL